MSRLHAYSKKYEAELQSRFGEYPDATTLVESLSRADPTPNKQYIEWLIKSYIRDEYTIDQLEMLKYIIGLYHKNKQFLPITQRDIMQWKLPDLRKWVVENFEQASINGVVEENDDYAVLYRGLLGTLYLVKSIYGACELGRGTKWCTTGSDAEIHYVKYADNELYIWIDRQRNNKKVQFHLPSAEIEDDKDGFRMSFDLRREYRERHPVLKQIFSDFEQRVVKGEAWTDIVRYMGSFGIRRWKEVEHYLWNSTIAYGSFWYYMDRVREPLPESEHIIIQHPPLIYQYARTCLKRRWPEAEAKLLENPEYAVMYAIDVIKGRWPELEKILLQHPKQLAIYAKKFGPIKQ